MKTVPAFAPTFFGMLAVCLLVLSGCATPSAPPGASSAAATNDSMMKAYREYKAAWNRHDVAAATSYYRQNGTLNNPAAGGQVSGPALAGWMQALFTAIPDFKIDIVSADPVGNQKVADQWVIKGTWTQPFPAGPLAGMKPTGKSFMVPGAGYYEWKDGKMVSATHYFDQLAFLTQIGVIGQK